MARDLRMIGFNRNRYPDKCYLYDSSAVNNNKLVKDATAICRFYKTDVVPFQWEKAKVNNGLTNSRKQFVGTIETADHLTCMWWIRPVCSLLLKMPLLVMT